MSYETIHVEMREGAVGVLIFNRPDALNALSVKLAEEFPHALMELKESGARALVITGAGRAFCAGGDLREMKQIAEKEGRIEAFFEEPLRLLHDCVMQVRELPMPVIAAVNGVCAGAGTNFALACDIVLAAESASFNQGFVKIGLTPDCGGTYILPQLVGPKIATELLMTGDTITAKRASEIGMINRVVSDADLMNEAMALATRLAAGPTAALSRIKKLIDQSTVSDFKTQLDNEHQSQVKSAQSSDFREGVAAFFEKRPPNFSGK
jgi:2-(1,2-epoxy-1,2-dihydrophenyl)acetyl-CoA isomerase